MAGQLLSVEEALKRIMDTVGAPVPDEELPLSECLGRYLARDIAATRNQPPFRASAMDGYALRSADITSLPKTFQLVGESAAGKRFDGSIGKDEAIRIFTGAPVPDDADTVVMQEDTTASDETVDIEVFHPSKRHIRDAGIDFATGQILLEAGLRLDARHLGLAAAMGLDRLPVRVKPRIAILATGDELVEPGGSCNEDQIFSSNSYSLKALAEDAGAEVIDLGIARDDTASLKAAFAELKRMKPHMLITMGGVSVGDRDLVQPVLLEEGMTLDFWKVAIRPGKPLMFGTLDSVLLFGLPGNPVSAYITGLIFAVPAIRAFLGARNAGQQQLESCLLGADIAANGERQDHLRATLGYDADGFLTATPMELQDSSLLSVLANADALIVRKPLEAASPKGSLCRIIRLGL